MEMRKSCCSIPAKNPVDIRLDSQPPEVVVIGHPGNCKLGIQPGSPQGRVCCNFSLDSGPPEDIFSCDSAGGDVGFHSGSPESAAGDDVCLDAGPSQSGLCDVGLNSRSSQGGFVGVWIVVRRVVVVAE